MRVLKFLGNLSRTCVARAFWTVELLVFVVRGCHRDLSRHPSYCMMILQQIEFDSQITLEAGSGTLEKSWSLESDGISSDCVAVPEDEDGD